MEPQVSEKIKEHVQEYLQSHPDVKKIAEIGEQIQEKKVEIITLEADLSILQKTRPEINIEYRKSILWCLTIDADNAFYFLKSKEGLVKCVEYKHKAKLAPRQNNALGGTLSNMFKEGLVGRIVRMDVFYYGLPKFFDLDKDGLYTILKKKHEKNLFTLKDVCI